ncbi:hypothetical protein [Oceanimonas doudoroffii]|uniref:hypothetical protein n=1 Tax=Oceanimonas doudoroffii TaxID=84158 RepID=UPI001140839A|nr:hypothetical protein [Oceanimonas doudoroffii]
MKSRFLILSIFPFFSMCVQASTIFYEARDVQTFEVMCKNERHNITTHYKLLNGVYSSSTMIGGADANILLSVVPNRVALAERKYERNTGETVEWSEIIISIREDSEFFEASIGEPDFMTITISTDNYSASNKWSKISVKTVEAFLDEEGNLQSIHNSDSKKEWCALINVEYK